MVLPARHLGDLGLAQRNNLLGSLLLGGVVVPEAELSAASARVREYEMVLVRIIDCVETGLHRTVVQQYRYASVGTVVGDVSR